MVSLTIWLGELNASQVFIEHTGYEYYSRSYTNDEELAQGLFITIIPRFSFESFLLFILEAAIPSLLILECRSPTAELHLPPNALLPSHAFILLAQLIHSTSRHHFRTPIVLQFHLTQYLSCASASANRIVTITHSGPPAHLRHSAALEFGPKSHTPCI